MSGSAATAARKSVSQQALQPLLHGLDGEIRFDEETRAAAADDFGHIVEDTPIGVLLPGSDEDIARAVHLARALRGKVAPQGQSHSVFGRSMARDGLVVDMSTMNSIGTVQSDRVVVGAGAKWSDVLRATLAQGKTPPVLTDYIELSVGGTIVAGGVGSTTSTHGVVADNVIELDVVTGKGQRFTCSASRRSDLFNAVRAGLGQVGIITSATIKLIDAPESARRFQLSYPDLATMLSDQRLLSRDNRFDVVQGAIAAPPTGFAFRIDAVKYFTGNEPEEGALLEGLSDIQSARQISTLAYFDFLNRLSALEALLRGNGQWFFPHPWLTSFVGDSEVESVVSGELDRLNPLEDLGQFGQIILSPLTRSAIKSPLMRLPSDSLCYAFNFVRVPTTDDAANAQRLVDANKAAYGRIRAAGGTLYPVHAFSLSRYEWRRHFGAAFSRLSHAKHKYDPGDVLTPGYEIF
ncbi:FAD-binding protein [Actinophytocola sp.]|uniref:FAD-binding protein n=1 Tax=Actinophytocola sp. TaxID=1872138 RepID=UPI003D6AF82A